MRRERVRILKTFLGRLGLSVHDPVRVLSLCLTSGSHCHQHPFGESKIWKHWKVFPKKSFKKEAQKIPRGAGASGLGGIHSWTPRVATSRISLEDQGCLLSAPFKDSDCCCLRFGAISSLYFPLQSKITKLFATSPKENAIKIWCLWRCCSKSLKCNSFLFHLLTFLCKKSDLIPTRWLVSFVL